MYGGTEASIENGPYVIFGQQIRDESEMTKALN